jgi:hypothetical protein
VACSESVVAAGEESALRGIGRRSIIEAVPGVTPA